MVVPQFPKRADAKNAVCLAALAAGVGAYVRGISAALKAKIPSETKALVYESIIPLLNTEYAKVWPNKLPEMFEYTKDRDGTYGLFGLHGDVSLTTCMRPLTSVWMHHDAQAYRSTRRTREVFMDRTS